MIPGFRRAGLIRALVIVALLVPLAFASNATKTPFHLGLPLVHSGDEVHYLVTINSVILDGDLDLANNYAAVHAGADQAGARLAGSRLNHHTVWFEGSERREWLSVYDPDGRTWDRDQQGVPVPRLRDDVAAPSTGHSEYSTHPPGLALMLAPVVYAVRGTGLVESLAIVCSAVATIIAAFAFAGLVQRYTDNAWTASLAMLVAFLGTPAWHYSRTLFTEPYLLAFAIGAYSLTLRNKAPVLAGLLLGLGLLFKPPFALLALPLIAMHLADRNLRSLVLLVVPLSVALAAYLTLNHHMFGAPWRAAQQWRDGSFIRGAAGAFIHPQYGYLFIAPAIAVAIALWPRFLKTHTKDACVIGGGIVLLFCFYASYGSWAGATSYAARYFVPLLPLVFVPLVLLPTTVIWQRSWMRRGAIAVCVVSIVLNCIAAIQYWTYWDTHPLRIAYQWASGSGG